MKEATTMEQLEGQLPPGEACLVLLTIHEWFHRWTPKRSFIKFPERSLTIKEQSFFMYELQKKGLNNQLIITTSPYIVSDFKRSAVRVFDGKGLSTPKTETYGTDPAALLYELFNYDTLIGARAAEDLKKLHERVDAESDMLPIKEASRIFGESAEKVLLFYHIMNKGKISKEAL